jgi:hypothetical protein
LFYIKEKPLFYDMLEYLVFVAAALSLLAALVYVRSMFKGEAKPNRVSWLMWAIAPFIATAAAISNGVGWSVLPVFMSGFGPFLIFIASFAAKKAFWKLTTFDYFCGAASVLALILWYFTKNPNVAIVLAIGSDAIASVPTLTKAARQPKTESSWPFTTGIFGAIASFAAARLWTFGEIAFPVYLLIINALLTLAIYGKRLALFLKK